MGVSENQYDETFTNLLFAFLVERTWIPRPPSVSVTPSPNHTAVDTIIVERRPVSVEPDSKIFQHHHVYTHHRQDQDQCTNCVCT